MSRRPRRRAPREGEDQVHCRRPFLEENIARTTEQGRQSN